jgi:hypothetical protein
VATHSAHLAKSRVPTTPQIGFNFSPIPFSAETPPIVDLPTTLGSSSGYGGYYPFKRPGYSCDRDFISYKHISVYLDNQLVGFSNTLPYQISVPLKPGDYGLPTSGQKLVSIRVEDGNGNKYEKEVIFRVQVQ